MIAILTTKSDADVNAIGMNLAFSGKIVYAERVGNTKQFKVQIDGGNESDLERLRKLGFDINAE